MKLPKAFTNDSDLGMCYEKTVIMNESLFFCGNVSDQIDVIHRLLQCMKVSNEMNKHSFPFYLNEARKLGHSWPR